MRFGTLSFRAFVVVLCLNIASAAHAEALPAIVSTQFAQPLEKVGSGSYKKFGFTIYDATLWAPEGKYDKTKPYALQLLYKRSLSREILSDNMMESFRAQNVADGATLERWQAEMQKMLSPVKEGDKLVALSTPGSSSVIYLNGKELARIGERAFSDALFAIWLGPTADEVLQAKLIGLNTTY